MKATLFRLAWLPLLVGQFVLAQPAPPPDTPPVEDFKPAPSNQPGRQYPQVNSEGRARFRIMAPQDQPAPSGTATIPEEPGIEKLTPAEIIKAGKTLRIKAGQDTPFKDSQGNIWLAEGHPL
jgi:hypothetical protein